MSKKEIVKTIKADVVESGLAGGEHVVRHVYMREYPGKRNLRTTSFYHCCDNGVAQRLADLLNANIDNTEMLKNIFGGE